MNATTRRRATVKDPHLVHHVTVPGRAERTPVETIRQRFARELREGTLEIPELPATALELGRLAACLDPDVPAAVRVVERDPQLAGRILALARSAAFGPTPPRDLQQAVMRLGVNGLRDAAFAASIGHVFRSPQFDELVRSEIMHAFVVGVGSAVACRALGVGGREGFVCGLLHDVGRLALLTALARWCRDDPWMADPAKIAPILEELHPEAGRLVLSSWGVSGTARGVAEHHHAPHEAGAFAPVALAVATVDLADRIEADDAEQRAQQLCAEALGYQAGLDASALQAVATAVTRARGDEMLAQLVG